MTRGAPLEDQAASELCVSLSAGEWGRHGPRERSIQRWSLQRASTSPAPYHRQPKGPHTSDGDNRQNREDERATGQGQLMLVPARARRWHGRKRRPGVLSSTLNEGSPPHQDFDFGIGIWAPQVWPSTGT